MTPEVWGRLVEHTARAIEMQHEETKFEGEYQVRPTRPETLPPITNDSNLFLLCRSGAKQHVCLKAKSIQGGHIVGEVWRKAKGLRYEWDPRNPEAAKMPLTSLRVAMVAPISPELQLPPGVFSLLSYAAADCYVAVDLARL